MAALIYSAIMSLDGYVADRSGNFDWAEPDEEVHAFVNDLARPVGTFLLGRRMYDVLLAWETIVGEHPIIRDFAEIWHGADKVVYSRTLDDAPSERTRIERDFDPDAVRRLKATAERDLAVGGSDVASQAMRAGLVDAHHLVVVPVVVGGGTPAFSTDALLPLELVDERRFGGGAVYLHYRPRGV